MNERQLEYVIAIAETGSFTAAAERCHTAQSALSHQIASLERHLGVKLFDRTSRSVRLTEAGRALLPVARRVLGDLTDVRARLDDISGLVRGPLRIGATQTAARVLDLAQLVADYDRKYPDVALSLILGPGYELLGALHSGELDLAFTAASPEVPEGVEFVPPGRREPLVAVVCAGHPLARQATAQLRELAAVSRFVDFRAHTTLWNKVEAMSAAAGVQREVMCEMGSIAEMVRLAAAGAGVAIVPRSFTMDIEGQTPPPEGIRALPLAEPDSYLTMGMFYEHARPGASPAVRALAELFSQERHLVETCEITPV